MNEKNNPFEKKIKHTLIFPDEKNNNYFIKEEGENYTRNFERVVKPKNFSTEVDTNFICKPIDYMNGTKRFDHRYIHFNVKETTGSIFEWFKKPTSVFSDLRPNINISVKCNKDKDINEDDFIFQSNENKNQVRILTTLNKLKFDELLELLLKDRHLEVSISISLKSIQKIMYSYQDPSGFFMDTKDRHFKIITNDIKFSNKNEELKSIPEDFFRNYNGKGCGVEFSWTKLF